MIRIVNMVGFRQRMICLMILEVISIFSCPMVSLSCDSSFLLTLLHSVLPEISTRWWNGPVKEFVQ